MVLQLPVVERLRYGRAGGFRGFRWADTGRGEHDSRARLPKGGETRPEGRKCRNRSMAAGGPV